jgi:hypothetical protein
MEERLVVVRTGYTPINWYRQGKWSTPEQPLALNNQTVRKLSLEGVPLIVLFVGAGDGPLFLVKVHEIRGRDVELDAAYPYANEYGPFLTFMTFDNDPVYAITPELQSMFTPILNSIRYTYGQELIISEELSRMPILYYNALSQNKYRMPYFPLNATYILPN